MAIDNILVLGGYGGAGSAISRLILKMTPADLIVAGRREDRARGLAEALNREFSGDRATYTQADASDPPSLREAFRGADLVIDAATTVPFVEMTARAAIAAGSDWIDIHYPQAGVAVLEGLRPEIEGAGLVFVTQAGFLPGLPSVLAQAAEGRFTRYRKAAAYVAMRTDFEAGGAALEFVEALGEYSAEVFRDGRWRGAGAREVRKVDFGPPLGVKTCYPTTLAEMRGLPEMLGVEELGAYVAGINWFVDGVVTPLAYLLGRVKSGLGRDRLAGLLVWGSKRFTPPGEAVAVVLEAEGERGGEEVLVRLRAGHDDVYGFTAMPVVALLLQILDGKARTPGLSMMGHLVDPVRLLEDLVRMGAELVEEVQSSSGPGG
ncbi:MAG TPA: saccharopine dehydrogenase NADP-binding domain-containing protein [Methanothrix sp.]|nr:polysaccharide biosynthesis protein [Methanothrix sp.]HOI69824.1 saccharopine dehydrogenase NADP-binding domain-containing protein [Methanothrix sp.]HPY71677.1 saccharopine dehydrogenase NADP-binding domain-containing protein [Methanothrix sp.]HQA61384.1 saccharopine dehydrogenase NADP-binding domain-containing protein [Methanothrix sp.]